MIIILRLIGKPKNWMSFIFQNSASVGLQNWLLDTIRLDALLQAKGFNCVHLKSSNICVNRMDKTTCGLQQ